MRDKRQLLAENTCLKEENARLNMQLQLQAPAARELTKSGSRGKTRVDFRSDWGASNMAVDYRPQLGGPERRAVLQEGLKNYYLYEEKMTTEKTAEQAAKDIDEFAAMPATG